MLDILVLRGALSETQALRLLQNREADLRVDSVEKVYYPYVKLLYSFSLKGKMARYNRQMLCSVDLVYGRPAIGQGKPLFEKASVPEDSVLSPAVEEETFLQTSRDYVFKLFISKMKILQTPAIAVDEKEYFYKLFYVFHCMDPEDDPYGILVDSMDGTLALLE